MGLLQYVKDINTFFLVYMCQKMPYYFFMTMNKYLNKVESILEIEKASNKTIDELIDYLISLIPNNGLLYKYRKLEDDYYLDNLQYIFLPCVSKLNDKVDTSLFYKSLHTNNEIIDFYFKNRYFVYRYYIKKHCFKDLEKRVFVVNGFIDGKTEFDIAHLLCEKNKMSNTEALLFVIEIKKDIETIIAKKEVLDDCINSYKKIGNRIKNDFHVFSMCETYYQDAMWAYYCNNNKGYVVEYDFKRIKALDYESKKRFVYTYKVRYSDVRECFDMLAVLETIFCETKDQIKKANLNVQFNKQLITKSKSWEHEREWRIVLPDGVDKIYANIISSIIFDESIIEDDKVIQMIAYCLDNDIDLKVRTLDEEKLNFNYINYKDTIFWKRNKKKIKKLMIR